MTVSLALSFKSWKKFRAASNADYRKFLIEVAREAKKAFREGIKSGKSGRKHSSLPNRSSAAGEYPASQSGALLASITSRTGAMEVTIGSNRPYSLYLRNGTSRMAARKMSDDALQEGIERAGRLGKWAGWEPG